MQNINTLIALEETQDTEEGPPAATLPDLNKMKNNISMAI
jgi:hypothetical protein